MFENNVLLTQTERLMMNSRPKQPKYARNKNVLVVGGSGSGKTRFFVKPNLMQMHSSYLVSDPKGTLLLECGKLLERGSPKLGEDGKPVRKNGKLVYEPYRMNNAVTGWRAFSNPRYFPEPYRRQKGWERIRNDNEPDNSMDGFQEIPTEEMEQLGLPEEWLKQK